MKLFPCFLVALLLPASFFGQTNSAQPAPQPEVILLGTAHNMHFALENHYSLIDLRTEIEGLHPDLICGEITPEAYHSVMEGYFPPEASYVAEIASSLKARFVPADWRIAYAWQSRAESTEPEEKRKQEAEIDRKQMEGMTAFHGVSLFDYLHSPSFISLSDEKFEQVAGENTVSDIAAGGWHERNRKIVENCLDDSAGARRVVFVFGANHIQQLRRQLLARDITAGIATRQFTPAGMGSVPPAVVARWQKNLENLQGVLEGRIHVSRDSMDKLKHSHRIDDLSLAMKTYCVEMTDAPDSGAEREHGAPPK
jgi:hypothetical protein